MAQNQVLLLQPVQGLGSEGETVAVRSGYARNFLLPRGLALPINQSNRKRVDSLLKAREAREQREFEVARELGAKIETLNIAVAVKTGEGGKMFGAVTANDLLERLAAEGIKLDRKQFALPAPVKELGSHTAGVKLHPDVPCELKFEVVSENPIEVPEAAEEESAGEDEE